VAGLVVEVLLIAFVAWFAVALFVFALCVAAKRGDRLARELFERVRGGR